MVTFKVTNVFDIAAHPSFMYLPSYLHHALSTPDWNTWSSSTMSSQYRWMFPRQICMPAASRSRSSFVGAPTPPPNLDIFTISSSCACDCSKPIKYISASSITVTFTWYMYLVCMAVMEHQSSPAWNYISQFKAVMLTNHYL